MNYLKERLKHAIRFRHKRGFGVHSPFMFNLILNVIRDKEKQFTYPEALEKADLLSRRERKVFRLQSRLIRHLKVKRAVCFGNKATLLTQYLSMAYPEALITPNQTQELSQAVFIYIGRQTCRQLQGNTDWGHIVAHPPRYIVIADIYKDNFNACLWRQLKEKATVSVDMMWYGLLLFDDKIQQGKYNLII